MENIRTDVAGINLPQANTDEAKNLQSRLPKAPVLQGESVTFEGAGTFFIPIEGDKDAEVKFKKANNHRYTTTDEKIVSELTKRGFKIITKKQLQEERETKLKNGRNEKTTNATMQDYVDGKIEELKGVITLSGSSNHGTAIGPTVTLVEELVKRVAALEKTGSYDELKKTVDDNKYAVNKRIDRLKTKLGVK